MTTSTTRRERGRRTDYTPGVRPRAARQEGQRRLTPGYLDDLSDTKTHYEPAPANNTDRSTLITPTTGKKVRLIRVKVSQTSSDGLHHAELYFGTGANLATNAAKAIELIRVPDLSEGTTRSWGRGAGPVGLKNEVVSFRWTVAPTTTHTIILEYTEER